MNLKLQKINYFGFLKPYHVICNTCITGLALICILYIENFIQSDGIIYVDILLFQPESPII